ncbi:porin family protein [Mitsuaria sp. GD03876]|uniref:porin family protein n=1 Tax=Mitsuaria sp. GD03876 TaxID=2975399 RepID=UPI002447138B|nr:porin family protein [Mitsuaria sp. GD03876]MDH0868082.1 porin family protein [Mitsuaria sp. GD03876]
MTKISFIAAAALLAAGAAQAQSTSGVYVEGGYTFAKAKDTDLNVSAKPGIIRGIVGWDVHPNVAIEAMLAGGAGDDSSNGLTVKVQRSYGLFVKPKFAVTPEFEVFGRLGFADTKVKLSSSQGSISDSDNSFAWGLGASYSFNKQFYATADYGSYYKKDGFKLTGFTLGAGYRF